MQGFPGPLMPPLPPFTGLQLRAWSDLRGEGNRSNIWTGFLFIISKFMWIDLCCFMYLSFYTSAVILFICLYICIYSFTECLTYHGTENKVLSFFSILEKGNSKKTKTKKRTKTTQYKPNLFHIRISHNSHTRAQRQRIPTHSSSLP